MDEWQPAHLWWQHAVLSDDCDDYSRLNRYADITRGGVVGGAGEYYHKKARLKNIQIKKQAQNA